MSRPPLRPIIHNNHKYSYFEYLVKFVIKKIEIDDTSGRLKPRLDFTGYNDLIENYKNLKLDEPDKAWELAKNFNMWIEYFSSLNSIFEDLYLDAETYKMKEIAVASYEADNKSVANGSRLANKNEQVIEARKIRNIYKSFYNELSKKIEFLEKAYYHCKSTYQLYQKKEDNDDYSQK